MSKRINQVAIAVLISLAVVAGVYTSVLGARATSRVGSHLVSGAMVNLNHYRGAALQQINYGTQTNQIHPDHNCDSDLQTAPDD